VVHVTFRRDSRNRLSSVFSSGHVEIESTSSDEYSLVCAAISAILQAARLGLEEYAKIALEAEQQPGEMALRWPMHDRDDPRVEAIVRTAELAIEQIASQYPQYVRVEQEPEQRA
jgi:uncharacterized protein YsxB (DUF464 family)